MQRSGFPRTQRCSQPPLFKSQPAVQRTRQCLSKNKNIVNYYISLACTCIIHKTQFRFQFFGISHCMYDQVPVCTFTYTAKQLHWYVFNTVYLCKYVNSLLAEGIRSCFQILQLLQTFYDPLSRTTQMSRYHHTRRINHSGFCWSRHDGVAVASAEPYASYLHFADT